MRKRVQFRPSGYDILEDRIALDGAAGAGAGQMRGGAAQIGGRAGRGGLVNANQVLSNINQNFRDFRNAFQASRVTLLNAQNGANTQQLNQQLNSARAAIVNADPSLFNQLFNQNPPLTPQEVIALQQFGNLPEDVRTNFQNAAQAAQASQQSVQSATQAFQSAIVTQINQLGTNLQASFPGRSNSFNQTIRTLVTGAPSPNSVTIQVPPQAGGGGGGGAQGGGGGAGGGGAQGGGGGQGNALNASEDSLLANLLGTVGQQLTNQVVQQQDEFIDETATAVAAAARRQILVRNLLAGGQGQGGRRGGGGGGQRGGGGGHHD